MRVDLGAVLEEEADRGDVGRRRRVGEQVEGVVEALRALGEEPVAGQRRRRLLGVHAVAARIPAQRALDGDRHAEVRGHGRRERRVAEQGVGVGGDRRPRLRRQEERGGHHPGALGQVGDRHRHLRGGRIGEQQVGVEEGARRAFGELIGQRHRRQAVDRRAGADRADRRRTAGHEVDRVEPDDAADVQGREGGVVERRDVEGESEEVLTPSGPIAISAPPLGLGLP